MQLQEKYIGSPTPFAHVKIYDKWFGGAKK